MQSRTFPSDNLQVHSFTVSLGRRRALRSHELRWLAVCECGLPRGVRSSLSIEHTPIGSGVRDASRLRLVLNANALAEYTTSSHPTIDATAVIANLKPTALDRLDDMKVFATCNFAQHDVAYFECG